MQREAGKEGIPLQKRVLEVGGKKALGGESAEGSRKRGDSSAREVAVVGVVCRGKWRKRGFLCKVEAEKSKVEERKEVPSGYNFEESHPAAVLKKC